ncbi:hypothetical protein HAZT_HAZT003838 [Hyalella azteca]|uniref:Uncharacterized protein n=1 Tax=Hyalella azteca TaxID=294128 RepID=A0A6A0H368_HYAAZ|nr:hypothetical protein HAZT_HAZT003838 [Hyalella azteca]
MPQTCAGDLLRSNVIPPAPARGCALYRLQQHSSHACLPTSSAAHHYPACRTTGALNPSLSYATLDHRLQRHVLPPPPPEFTSPTEAPLGDPCGVSGGGCGGSGDGCCGNGGGCGGNTGSFGGIGSGSGGNVLCSVGGGGGNVVSHNAILHVTDTGGGTAVDVRGCGLWSGSRHGLSLSCDDHSDGRQPLISNQHESSV